MTFKVSTIFRRAAALSTAALITFGPGVSPVFAAPPAGKTATPIKHLVIVFQENISFDHYFGSYPRATNPSGEPRFFARKGTPTVNGYTPALLNNNPNLNPLNGAGASNPFRLDRSQAVTADQDHGYTDEQKAFDNGLMDLFALHEVLHQRTPQRISVTTTVTP
jgi:phospholipase C